MKITDDQLISQYSQLHKKGKYGQTAHGSQKIIGFCLDELKPATLLEYGCGQSQLHRALGRPGMTWDRYDPAIPELAAIPRESYDFVFCTDVLEHIPTDDVPDVLDHLSSLSPTVFLRVSTRPARTILPDGRNAHLTVWPGQRWLEAVSQRFADASLIHEAEGESCVIATWKCASAEKIRSHLDAVDRKRRSKFRSGLKKIERRFRSLRDSLIGRKRRK